MQTDWEAVNLLGNNSVSLSSYNFITIVIVTGVCVLVAFLYHRYCYDRYKQLTHRQKLARMVLENGWFIASKTESTGFSLTCKADQGKKSYTSQRYITAWKMDCFISSRKSHWESIKTSY